MGVDSRRPILPAPTDSLVGTSVTPTDLETDISRRTDRTSYSIPEDGKAVTIPLQRQRRDREGSSKLSPAQNSHTSLLIEYFEGGKGSSSLTSRPSVRVRVTPSGARKSRDQKDTVQISESGGSQRPVFTRRISLGSPPSKQKQLAGGDAQSSTSSLSVEDLHASPRPPVEIELMDRDRGSELSDLRYVNQASEVSTMPPDSMLDATSSPLRHKRSQSLGREEATRASKDFLKTPSRQRSRSLSKERIAHRVAEKLSSEPRDISTSKHRRSGKNRGGSKDLFMEEDTKAPRRKVNRHREIELSSPDSSLLSASVTSSHQRSADQNSYRSSKSSLNNPKLLETVEDAIRRLILPELKELKKDQKVLTNTSKFERDLAPRPLATASSKGELGRRLSKHSSAPDVTRHTSTDRSLGTKDRKPSKDAGLTFVKRGSRPDLTEKDLLRRQKSKSLRDAEAAGRVGTALTAAALSRHDSESTLDHGRSRASRSGTGTPNETELGVNETELVFQKHNVPPMPLNSEVDSGLTRDSLLSEKTAEPSTPATDTRVRDVARGSPAQNASPSPSSRVSHRSRLGFHHSNMSSHNLSFHGASDHDLREHSHSPMSDSTLGSGDVAEAAAANLLGVDPGFHGSPDEHSDFSNRQRTLSPIQSVASGRTEDTQTGHPEVPQEGHADSEGERRLEPHLSIESLSSAPSTDLARSTRLGPSIDSRSELAKDEPGLGLGYEESPRPSQGSRGWQDSEAKEGSRSDLRDTHHVDDSEVDYLQKVNQGQHVADVRGANPKFFQPLAVESAVASLLDPSVVTSNVSKVPANRSQPDLGNQESQSASRTPQPMEDTTREQHTSLQEAPTKQRQDAASPGAISPPKRIDTTSPPQSVAQSIENQEESEHQAPIHASDDESPDHEAGHSPETESEINTNPSIIQGPIGGMPHGAQVPWAYDPTSAKTNQLPYPDDHELANDPMGYDYHGYSNTVRRATYDSNGFFNQPDDYMGEQLFATPPGAKDEGYVSAANPLSPSIGSPQPASKGLGGLNANPVSLFDNPIEDDLFGATSHQRNLSGYSHGIPSPLYDSATGRGIERIKSKDIVALMDHLTVRDAQRNARDTEILVTLVRSAAEMRNSFEEMKKFIAQQDGLIMEASGKQHEQTQKLIGGPRPLPPSGPRTMRQLGSEEGEDLRTKRRNVFKRALKGLTLKSSNDLTKIEEMLEQLLEEVEALRAVQGDRTSRSAPQAATVDPEGYEPEGRAGTSTSSPGNQSGYFSNSSRPLADSRGIRRDSAHRVSTVHEEDEDIELEEGGGQFSNPSSGQFIARHARAESAPLNTPPKIALNSGSASNETTPKTSEKARKHKSSSSSFFPKISRWSKTTTSSADNTRNSAQPPRKDLPYSDMSRSGSDLAQEQYKTSFYDPHGDDRLRSTHTLDDQRQQENRPPSPLVPSQVSETPKYRAHRDSLNLQHPQPRQGPSGRYQSQLESQAYDFRSPVSPTSDQWGSNPSLVGPASAAQNRYSNGGHLSPISDTGYSEATSRTGKTPPPPRPPKLRDDGPLVPERPPKVNEDEGSSYVDRVVSRSSAMRSTPPLRKPTGPRPLTSGGNQYSPGHSKRTRYRGSPVQSVDDDY